MKDLTRYEAMHREVETLGDAGNYHGQAQAFLAGTETIIEARFHAMKAGHFGPDDKDIRDIWEIRMTRNGRVYQFHFGESIKRTEERLERIAGSTRSESGERMRHGYTLGFPAQSKFQKWETAAREWVKLETMEAMSMNAPKAYSILACMTTYEPGDVDEFAANYGYEKPSQAIRAHEAVTKEYNALRAMFDNDELETLALIN